MQAILGRTRTAVEETGQEHETERAGNFQCTKRNLPTIDCRIGIPILDRIFSYLGQRNPFAYDVDPAKEVVWLLDNTAYRPTPFFYSKCGPWQAEFRAAYFKRGTANDVGKIVAAIADYIELGKGLDMDGDGDEDEDDRDLVAKTIAERLQPFVNTIAPARSVKVTLPTCEVLRLGPGGPSAGSKQIVSRLGEHEDGEVAYIPATPQEVTPYGPMKTYFAGPEGWAVISGNVSSPLNKATPRKNRKNKDETKLDPTDIDDTIKTTMTPSPIGILRSTFITAPTPIPSMPSLYTHISQTLSPTWFYLSASPYNLYPFLSAFISAHYPPGPVFLRSASWMDLSALLASLTQGTRVYKRRRMETMHGWFPQRKIICVGDSTQTDPEAYGDICRMYPGWVKRVWIRRVVDVAEMQWGGKNEMERFEKAFKGVDRRVWKTFEDPVELWGEVEMLLSDK